MVLSIVDEGVKFGTMIAEEGDYKIYKSFTYRGVEYSLYDAVYSFSEGAKETDIGKIVMIWETSKEKKVKLVWFFRPRDVVNFLRGYRPAWNQLFLACGTGDGVSNIIPLEAIIGKCNVICTSRDRRNIQPSKSDVLNADYFFSHVFDVGTSKLSEKLPDTIWSVKVERLLNRGQDKPKANVVRIRCKVPNSKTEDTGKPYPSEFQVQTPNDNVNVKNSDVKEETFAMFEQLTPENQPLKKRKVSEEDSECILKPKSRASGDKVADVANGNLIEKSQRPATDLICLAFNLSVDAKIIPRTSFSNSWHGEAMVIFDSMDDANFVISELNRRCLVTGKGRPVVAFKSKLIEHPTANHFPGHIMLELYEKKKRNGKAKAVSTSHCAQHNTGEYQMAAQWIILHEQTDRWFKELHKEQQKEAAVYLNKLKSRQSTEFAAVAPVSEETSKQQVGEVHKLNDTALGEGELINSQLSDHKEGSEAIPEQSAAVMLTS